MRATYLRGTVGGKLQARATRTWVSYGIRNRDELTPNSYDGSMSGTGGMNYIPCGMLIRP